KARGRKCLSHLENQPGLLLKVTILIRQSRGEGTCSGDYAPLPRETGARCNACRVRSA
ncbi:hypothetical protein B0H65DRAFT_388301, partial [Neurospora tetraspora]